ncbi:MAG: T9SS type A sorting domain-containing protein [Bacteroidota bacterium]
MKKTPLLLISFLLASFSFAADPDYPGVPYGPDARQFVDIYIAPSATPTPVYFDAHGNGATTNMPNAIINALKAEGISVVAWESLTAVNTQGQVDTAWNDAELMFAWVKANATTYNFDTTQFIIGGSSRGSIISWKYSHSGDPGIKGLYMYNALPDGVWADTTWWNPPNEVKVTSPPVFFVYKFEPGTNDIHDPQNGFKIMDTYTALGIGDKDTLIHSIFYTNNSDKYQFLVDFARSVLGADPALSIAPDESSVPALRAYPNPFQDTLEIAGLQGNEFFRLTALSGRLIQEGYMLDSTQLAKLSPGIYFLTVRSRAGQRVLKLIKD